jgi:DNA polymerase-4
MTRVNVYAGPAGFYLLRGGPGDDVLDAKTGKPAVLPGPAPAPGDLPGIRYYEIPIAIQDRSFKSDGSLFYPDNRAVEPGILTRSLTLPAPVSATRAIAEIAEHLVRGALADHPHEKAISLLAISVSNFDEQPAVQLELPLGLEDQGRRPGSRQGIARTRADRAVDAIRQRFGAGAIDYGSATTGVLRSVPDEFRRLAEKEL